MLLPDSVPEIESAWDFPGEFRSEEWWWQRRGYSESIRKLGDRIAALTLQEAQELSEYLTAKI